MEISQIEEKIKMIANMCNSDKKRIVFNDGCFIEGTTPQVVIRFIDGEWEICLEDGWHMVFAMKNVNNELLKEEPCFCGNSIIKLLNYLEKFCKEMIEKGYIFVCYNDL